MSIAPWLPSQYSLAVLETLQAIMSFGKSLSIKTYWSRLYCWELRIPSETNSPTHTHTHVFEHLYKYNYTKFQQWNGQLCLQIDYIILYFYQHCMHVPIFLHCCYVITPKLKWLQIMTMYLFLMILWIKWAVVLAWTAQLGLMV